VGRQHLNTAPWQATLLAHSNYRRSYQSDIRVLDPETIEAGIFNLRRPARSLTWRALTSTGGHFAHYARTMRIGLVQYGDGWKEIVRLDFFFPEGIVAIGALQPVVHWIGDDCRHRTTKVIYKLKVPKDGTS